MNERNERAIQALREVFSEFDGKLDDSNMCGLVADLTFRRYDLIPEAEIIAKAFRSGALKYATGSYFFNRERLAELLRLSEKLEPSEVELVMRWLDGAMGHIENPSAGDDDSYDDDYNDDDDDDIVTLVSAATGEEIGFIEIAGIILDGKFYAILQPVDLLPGMGDDEAMVFEVGRDANGDDKLEIVTNDDIIDRVFEKYGELYEEAHKKVDDDDND